MKRGAMEHGQRKRHENLAQTRCILINQIVLRHQRRQEQEASEVVALSDIINEDYADPGG